MKIDRAAISPVENVQATNRVNQTPKKLHISETDKVAVSDKLQVYQSILEKVKEIPAVREDRVRTLTEQIERGEFKVDGQKIADKLFTSEL